MGAGYILRCDKCGYSVSTSGPWEFYRDSNGNRKPYGHPGPASKEAEQSGIYGLSGRLYCPKCDKTFNLVMGEFAKPSQESLLVWLGRCEPKDEFKQEGTVKCPKCGGTNMILESVEGKEIVCPRCKEGKLVGEMEWIS